MSQAVKPDTIRWRRGDCHVSIGQIFVTKSLKSNTGGHMSIDLPVDHALVSPFTASASGQRMRAYARLVDEGPVHRITMPSGAPAWLVTGHTEVKSALSDPRLIKNGGPMTAAALQLSPDIDRAMNSDLLHLDPPDHTRLRRLVAAAFSRRRVDDLVPRMVQIADALLDAMARSPEPVDLIDAYAFPLPMTVICELLGVPAADAATFRRWSTTIVSGALSDPAEWVASATSLVEYTRALVEIKRATPTDDLLSALIASRDGADRLSEDELTSMVVLLLLAGHETTVNLIGNAANLLFEHPAQLAALRADPGLIPGVVEEVLRFESPVQVATPRFAAEQLRIADRLIEKGDMVFASVLTAGRFDDRLDHPAEFDPSGQTSIMFRSGTGSTTASARHWRARRGRSR